MDSLAFPARLGGFWLVTWWLDGTARRADQVDLKWGDLEMQLSGTEKVGKNHQETTKIASFHRKNVDWVPTCRTELPKAQGTVWTPIHHHPLPVLSEVWPSRESQLGIAEAWAHPAAGELYWGCETGWVEGQSPQNRRLGDFMRFQMDGHRMDWFFFNMRDDPPGTLGTTVRSCCWKIHRRTP